MLQKIISGVLLAIGILSSLMTGYYFASTVFSITNQMSSVNQTGPEALGSALGSAFALQHSTAQMARWGILTILSFGFRVLLPIAQHLRIIRLFTLRIGGVIEEQGQLTVDCLTVVVDNTKALREISTNLEDRSWDGIDRLEQIIVAQKHISKGLPNGRNDTPKAKTKAVHSVSRHGQK